MIEAPNPKALVTALFELFLRVVHTRVVKVLEVTDYRVAARHVNHQRDER